MNWRIIATLFGILFLFYSQAHAQIEPESSQVEPESSQVEPVSSKTTHTTDHIEFGAGLFGFANGNFIEQPKGDDLNFRPYPGFAGAGGGGGLALNALWRGIIGIELQIMHSVESAVGGMDVGAVSIDATIEQTSLHVPVLLKIQAPTESIRPFLVVGPDFVTPGETEMKSQTTNLFASADPYTALAFGFGLEFRLGLDDGDIRIPFAIRGSYNSNLPDQASERVEIGNSPIGPTYTYGGEWQWQAFVTLGVSYHFRSEI